MSILEDLIWVGAGAVLGWLGYEEAKRRGWIGAGAAPVRRFVQGQLPLPPVGAGIVRTCPSGYYLRNGVCEKLQTGVPVAVPSQFYQGLVRATADDVALAKSNLSRHDYEVKHFLDYTKAQCSAGDVKVKIETVLPREIVFSTRVGGASPTTAVLSYGETCVPASLQCPQGYEWVFVRGQELVYSQQTVGLPPGGTNPQKRYCVACVKRRDWPELPLPRWVDVVEYSWDSYPVVDEMKVTPNHLVQDYRDGKFETRELPAGAVPAWGRSAGTVEASVSTMGELRIRLNRYEPPTSTQYQQAPGPGARPGPLRSGLIPTYYQRPGAKIIRTDSALQRLAGILPPIVGTPPTVSGLTGLEESVCRTAFLEGLGMTPPADVLAKRRALKEKIRQIRAGTYYKQSRPTPPYRGILKRPTPTGGRKFPKPEPLPRGWFRLPRGQTECPEGYEKMQGPEKIMPPIYRCVPISPEIGKTCPPGYSRQCNEKTCICVREPDSLGFWASGGFGRAVGYAMPWSTGFGPTSGISRGAYGRTLVSAARPYGTWYGKRAPKPEPQIIGGGTGVTSEQQKKNKAEQKKAAAEKRRQAEVAKKFPMKAQEAPAEAAGGGIQQEWGGAEELIIERVNEPKARTGTKMMTELERAAEPEQAPEQVEEEEVSFWFPTAAELERLRVRPPMWA